MKQRKNLRDWLGLHKGEETKEECKKQRAKPFYAKVCPNNKEAEGST